jgi:multimeric flavodoxin WrbA
MAKVLVVYHSQGGNTKKMAEAIADGARSLAGAEVELKPGLEATVDDFLSCDGIALGSPDYFSYIAGGLKDFFDRTYYPTQGKVTGKPYLAFGSAGGPASTVLGIIERIAAAFKLEPAVAPVGSAGKPTAEVLDECRAAGQKLAQAASRR